MKTRQTRDLVRRSLMTALPAIAMVAVFATSALCASGGGEGDHKSQWWDFGWRVLNFAILIYIIYKLSWKKLVGFFRNRREDIKASIEDAKVRREEAEAKFKEYETKLTKATGEIDGISDMIRAQGQVEKDKLIADAEKQAEKMKEDAKARMDQEMKKASAQLRAEAVELSVQVAEDILKKNVKKEDHDNMAKDYIKRMVKEN